jgi:ribonuclease HII
MPKELERAFKHMGNPPFKFIFLSIPGMKDSKLLAPTRREHYAKILKHHPHVLSATIVVPASSLDKMMKKKSLNEINADATISLLESFNKYIEKGKKISENSFF